jgi:hypothetical protein
MPGCQGSVWALDDAHSATTAQHHCCTFHKLTPTITALLGLSLGDEIQQIAD